MVNLLRGIDIDFANQRGKATLIVTGEKVVSDQIVRYQVEMINGNEIPGLVPVQIREINSRIELLYDVDGLVNITSYMLKNGPSTHLLMTILNLIASVLLQCNNYFLDQNSFILTEDCIYIDPVTQEIKLVYLPIERNHDVNLLFKSLAVNLILNYVDLNVSDAISLELLNMAKDKDVSIKQFAGKLRKTNVISGDTFHSGEGLPDPQWSAELVSEQFSRDQDSARIKDGLDRVSFFNKLVIMAKGRPALSIMAAGSLLAVVVSLLPNNLLVRVKPNLWPKEFLGTISDSRNVILLFGLLLVVAGFYIILQGSQKNKKEDAQVGSHNASEVDITEAEYTVAGDDVPQRGLLLHSDETVLLSNTRFPRLRSLDGRETVIINKPEFTVGRNKAACDYVIHNSSIGRIHARFRQCGSDYYISDLDSKNGTFINGEGLLSKKECKLRDNDRVAFANMEYCFYC